MSENDIGIAVAIATGIPATFDKAGYEAAGMVYVNIGHPITVGEIGDEHETIAVPNLNTGRTRTIKGAAVGTTIPFTFGEMRTDNGQIAARTAARTKGGEYTIRITNVDGSIEYMSGVPMSWKRSERTTGSYPGVSFNMSMNYTPVEVPAPD